MTKLDEQTVRDFVTRCINTDFEYIGMRGSHVILRKGLWSPTIAERGSYLMKLEARLCDHFGTSLEVFLEPVGDMNKLRIKLRGVKV